MQKTLFRRIRRTGKWIHRKAREVKVFVRAMHSGSHPILANMVVTRRCNLACTYCNQYDKVSDPVPYEELAARARRLAELGTTIVTFTGGEPLLHPRLADLVRLTRGLGMVTIVNTNGYLLTPGVIESLNRAGLDHLFISVDNVMPDKDSQKSLKVLDKKLEMLAQHRMFGVTVNSVLGANAAQPEDAEVVHRRAQELGFEATVGLMHRAGGELIQLEPRRKAVYDRIRERKKGRVFAALQYDWFQNNLAMGIANDWHCPAGGRFLYICEDGLVHYCSQRRGSPGIPLSAYTEQHLRVEKARRKECAPFCTISCVQQTAFLDSFRSKPRETLEGILARQRQLDPGFREPFGVRALRWTFLDGPVAYYFQRAAAALLGGSAASALARPQSMMSRAAGND